MSYQSEPYFSVYDIVHLRASITALQRVERLVHLARGVFADGWRGLDSVWRPTEIEALMELAGYQPPAEASVDDLAWLRGETQGKRYQYVGRVCAECGQRHPLAADYWHRDGEGYHTICKRCRNAARRDYYAALVDRPVREYRRE